MPRAHWAGPHCEQSQWDVLTWRATFAVGSGAVRGDPVRAVAPVRGIAVGRVAGTGRGWEGPHWVAAQREAEQWEGSEEGWDAVGGVAARPGRRRGRSVWQRSGRARSGSTGSGGGKRRRGGAPAGTRPAADRGSGRRRRWSRRTAPGRSRKQRFPPCRKPKRRKRVMPRSTKSNRAAAPIRIAAREPSQPGGPARELAHPYAKRHVRTAVDPFPT